jgi:pyruvate/2-oxoglutarate dehydrogenase complex dihydrolipoamide dehydrogenase (E3) component
MLKRKHYDYDLIVIGSGSGGSVGAHYAASLGKRVAIFECEAIGGECPNFACVPTKALLHAASMYQTAKDGGMFGIKTEGVSYSYPKIKEWKDLVVSRTGAAHGKESFQKDNIDVYHAKAHFISPHEVQANGKIYSAAKFLIATGSKEFIPPVPGLQDAGYITFRQAIDFTKLPSSVLVFGGGAIGCEFSHIFSSFGSKVTLVNRSERIVSKEDQEVSELVKAVFENQGIKVLVNTTIEKVEKKAGKKIVTLKTGNEVHHHEVAEILISTGKVPVLDFDPEKAGIAIVDRRIKMNRYLQTNVQHIFAAGDVVGPYLFTHTGYYQSYIAAHNMFTRHPIVPDYRAIPRAIYIHPEVASVGMSEEEAIKKGIKIKKGITPIAVVGRANTSNELDGFVKVITDEKGMLIGASIVAPSAGEMIHELTLAIKLKLKATVLAEMIHAYPTFSEAIKIACSIVE